MAQVDGLRCMDGGEQGLGQGHWGAPVSPAYGRIYDHEEEHGHHHGKKSVLGKVKDVAKKLKHSISKKRHGHDGGDDGHYTRDWGIVLDEQDDPAQDPEFLGAPMYEPVPKPGSQKESATLQTATSRREKGTELPADGHAKKLEHLDSFKEKDLKGQVEPPPKADVADKHVTEAEPEQPAAGQGGNKTLTETVTEILSPAYVAVTEATRRIAAKIQSPQLGSPDREAMSKQMWDKGISVKEYLLQKLEPGEDEKALSEVITEAMSPRKRGADEGEDGMVDKVKGAVTSLLGKEKPAADQPAAGSHEIPWGNTVSKEVRPVLTYSKSQLLPVSTSPQVIQVSKPRSAISLPTTPHAPAPTTLAQPTPAPANKTLGGVIEEEQSLGKVLQAYLN